MSSVKLPLNVPPMEDESHASSDLSGRIWTFCKEQSRKENMNGNLLEWC